MICSSHSTGLLILIAALIGVSGGCNSESSKPAQPAAASVAKPETAAVTTTLASPEEPPFVLESDFTLLTLPQFDSFGAQADTWKETSDGMACTGKPRGYVYSKQSYKNFTLRLDYRFERPANLKDDAKFKGNTGFLVYITGEPKLWPACLEVQGKNVQMAAIKENGGADPVTVKDDDTARQSSRHAVGAWNSLEIVSKDGALKVSLNSTPISQSDPGPLVEGAIGIQSEDFPFEVRRMRIHIDE